jgi:hypothetical protein
MRADVLPEVPVMGDFVPGYEASAWLGFGAPKDAKHLFVAARSANASGEQECHAS